MKNKYFIRDLMPGDTIVVRDIVDMIVHISVKPEVIHVEWYRYEKNGRCEFATRNYYNYDESIEPQNFQLLR
jgi:hypothetical protein